MLLFEFICANQIKRNPTFILKSVFYLNVNLVLFDLTDKSKKITKFHRKYTSHYRIVYI